MKKCITFMVTALCMTFMSAMTSNAADKIIYGDVNGDGAVNSSDATEILNYYAQSLTGKNEDSAKNILEIGDVNEDGSVDSADASFTLEYYSYSHSEEHGLPGLCDAAVPASAEPGCGLQIDLRCGR